MFRKFAVALAVTLPLAAQVAETAALVRVDVVVTDAGGGRVRGLSAADFEVTEGERRADIVEFVEYATDAAATPAAPATDTRYVPLVTHAAPTPPRRLVIAGGNRDEAKSLIRPGDVVTTLDSADPSRLAAEIVRLARHPERKALVILGEVPQQLATFAKTRGVALYDRTTLSEAALDLGSYYSLAVRADNPRALQVKTTRPYTVRALVSSPRVSVEDAVLAHQVVEPESNDLDIAVNAEPTVVAADKRTVKVHVLIPIRRLMLERQGAEVTGGFDVYVSVSDEGGKVSAMDKQTHAIKWPAEALEKAGNRFMDYTVDVVVKPGPARISVGVVDHRSKKTGYRRIEVTG